MAPLTPDPGEHTAAPATSRLERATPDMVSEISALANEVGADVVILVRQPHLLAHAGRLSAQQASGVAQAIAKGWCAPQRAARGPGQEQLRFERDAEGTEYVYYSLAVAEPGIVLSLALRPGVSLGPVRQRARQAAGRLRELIDEAIDGKNERTGPD